MGLSIYAIPAIAALLAKGIIYLYARFSLVRNLETRLYLFFLFSLSIQNLSEIGLFMARADGIPSPLSGFIYFSTSIIALSFLLHLALVLAIDWRRYVTHGRLVLIYAPAAVLEALLWFTPWLVSGFEPFKYTYTKVAGSLYFLFELYALTYVAAVIGLLVYGGLTQDTIQKKTKNRLVLLGLMPMIMVVTIVIALQHFGIAFFNTIVTLPAATTVFLIITAYATHQHRLFDIEFYIPWSKVRKRKTAFYDRIRAMIAEIADLESVNDAISRLADTLRCPVALVGNRGGVLAVAGASEHMIQIPEDTLQNFDHIAVANEIADADHATHAVMKRHNIAAVVPFYPQTQNASGWLLLGDSFSEQVYTALDFRLVEELFDKMADLFLDRLLAMRAQLADARAEIRGLERRLQKAEGAVAPLRRELDVLRQENLRLIKEQPTDSLGVSTSRIAGETFGPTITLVGRDKAMRKRLRGHFPQLAQFVSPNSVGLRRQSTPEALVCRVDAGASATNEKLLKLVRGNRGRTAVLVYGPGASAFAAHHSRELRGSLIEVLPENVADEALIRKIRALAELCRAVGVIHDRDCPLIGRSQVFAEMLADAERIAGFSEPVLIESKDIREAVALARHIHDCGGRSGSFSVMAAARLAETELPQPLHGSVEATVMVDNLRLLPMAAQDKLRRTLARARELRVIAGCEGDVEETASRLQKLTQSSKPFLLRVPHLRERKIDIPLLIHYFTLQFNLQAGTHHYLSQGEVDDLTVENFPVDTSALKSLVFAGLQSKHQRPAKPTVVDYGATRKSLDEYVSEFEARLIAQTLARCDGNKSKAARLLGLRPNTLHYKLERYGLSGNKKR